MAQGNVYKCKPAGEVRVMTPVLIGSMVIAVIVIAHDSPRLFAAILVEVLVVVAIVVSYLYMPRAIVVDDLGVGDRPWQFYPYGEYSFCAQSE